MAERNPPLVLEGGSHDSDLLRQLWEATYTPGVVAAGDLLVTEQSTPALGVTVAAGKAFVDGDEAASQGVYWVVNDAAKNVALATADATNARKDLIVARVKDAFYSGALGEWAIEAVTGTPAGSPVAPAAPANSLVLAEVLVPADAGGNPAITNGDITDKRAEAALTDGFRTDGPLGVLGYASVTSAQGSITTDVDLTGLSVTIDVPAGRRVRVTGYVAFFSSVAGDFARLVVALGDNTVLENTNAFDLKTTAAQSSRVLGQRILTPSSGSNTYKLRASRLSGTGNITMHASATSVAFILVEDIGPA